MPTPIEHHPLSLLIAVAALLSSARIGGYCAKRLGQPTVVGEIAGGIALGPSVLGQIAPEVYGALFPNNAALTIQLQTLSLLGVLVLLFVTGLEVDVGLIRRQLGGAIVVAAGALSCSLAAGYAFAHCIPIDLIPDPTNRLVSCFVIGIAMSICAIPVLAKVLIDENITRKNLSQAILASAMIEDMSAWVLLASATAMVSGEAGGLMAGVTALARTALVVAMIVTIGRALASRFLDLSFHRGGGSEGSLVLALIGTLLGAVLSEAAHLEPLPGAFVTGIAFGLIPRFDRAAQHTLESLAFVVCGPLFFAISGLKVEIRPLLDPALLPLVLAMPVVALAAKGFGSFIVNRYVLKRDGWSAAFSSCGLLAQGSIGVVIANIALSSGLVSRPVYSMIIFSAVTTSIVGPALLRFTLHRLPADPEEELRLKREEASRRSLLDAAQRILVPVRFRPDLPAPGDDILASKLIDRIGAGRTTTITLFTVVERGMESRGETFLQQIALCLPGSAANVRAVVSDTPGDAIVQEAQKGYDLIVLGTPARSAGTPTTLFTPLIDYVTRLAPCPVFLMQGHPNVPRTVAHRILIPTNGSTAARQAAEVGFRLVDPDRSDILILKVLGKVSQAFDQESFERQREASLALVQDLQESAALIGIAARGEVRTGERSDLVILETAEDEGVDLIVLGTNVRPGSNHLYLGPRVERILMSAPCPVLVVNS